MYRRAFPSVTLWAGLGAIVAADLVLLAMSGFRVVGTATPAILAVCAAAVALGWLYATVRPDERLAALAFGAAYIIGYTFAAAVLNYVTTSAGLPLLDAQFARADAVLGLDWMAVLELCNAWPLLGKVLQFSYATSMMQIAGVLVLLTATRQLPRLADYLALFTATSLVIIALSAIFPAAGAYVLHDPPAALRNLGHDAGLWHLQHFEALRSGSMRVIDPSMVEGLITFPSFHTALAVITVWALWSTRYVRLPALVLNLLVIASTVPVGGHYFVDVIAGAAVAAVAIVAVTWQRRPAPAQTWAPGRASAAT